MKAYSTVGSEGQGSPSPELSDMLSMLQGLQVGHDGADNLNTPPWSAAQSAAANPVEDILPLLKRCREAIHKRCELKQGVTQGSTNGGTGHVVLPSDGTSLQSQTHQEGPPISPARPLGGTVNETCTAGLKDLRRCVEELVGVVKSPPAAFAHSLDVSSDSGPAGETQAAGTAPAESATGDNLPHSNADSATGDNLLHNTADSATGDNVPHSNANSAAGNGVSQREHPQLASHAKALAMLADLAPHLRFASQADSAGSAEQGNATSRGDTPEPILDITDDDVMAGVISEEMTAQLLLIVGAYASSSSLPAPWTDSSCSTAAMKLLDQLQVYAHPVTQPTQLSELNSSELKSFIPNTNAALPSLVSIYMPHIMAVMKGVMGSGNRATTTKKQKGSSSTVGPPASAPLLHRAAISRAYCWLVINSVGVSGNSSTSVAEVGDDDEPARLQGTGHAAQQRTSSSKLQNAVSSSSRLPQNVASSSQGPKRALIQLARGRAVTLSHVLPGVLTALDDVSASVRQYGLVALGQAVQASTAEEREGLEELLLDSVKAALLGCEEALWKLTCRTAVQVVEKVEGSDLRGSGYSLVMELMLDDVERGSRSLPACLVFMEYTTILVKRMRLMATQFLSRLMPLTLPWIHSYNPAMREAATQLLSSMMHVCWPRMYAHAALLKDHIQRALNVAASSTSEEDSCIKLGNHATEGSAASSRPENVGLQAGEKGKKAEVQRLEELLRVCELVSCK